MFAHEAGEHARPSIVDAAGAEAGDDPGGLAFEELPLGRADVECSIKRVKELELFFS
jgi:hypothetical protein